MKAINTVLSAVALCLLIAFLSIQWKLRSVAEPVDRQLARMAPSSHVDAAPALPMALESDSEAVAAKHRRDTWEEAAPVAVLASDRFSEDRMAYELETARAVLPAVFPDLAKALGLTAAEEEMLSAVLAKQVVARRLSAEVGRGNDKGSHEGRRDQALQTRQQNEAEIAGVLGGKYAKWVDYKGTIPARMQVRALQESLGADAIADFQREHVVHALAAQLEATGGMQDRAMRNSQLVLAVAPFLTSQQADRFRKLLDTQ